MKASLFVVIYLISFSAVTKAESENSSIFLCRVFQDGLKAELAVDSINKVSYKITSHEVVHKCNTKIWGAEDGTEGPVPNLYYRFERLDCIPALDADLKIKILENPNLIIETHLKKPSATLQWLKTSQPNKCELTKFRPFEARQNIKKLRG
jgi:hypothetical protein